MKGRAFFLRQAIIFLSVILVFIACDSKKEKPVRETSISAEESEKAAQAMAEQPSGTKAVEEKPKSKNTPEIQYVKKIIIDTTTGNTIGQIEKYPFARKGTGYWDIEDVSLDASSIALTERMYQIPKGSLIGLKKVFYYTDLQDDDWFWGEYLKIIERKCKKEDPTFGQLTKRNFFDTNVFYILLNPNNIYPRNPNTPRREIPIEVEVERFRGDYLSGQDRYGYKSKSGYNMWRDGYMIKEALEEWWLSDPPPIQLLDGKLVFEIGIFEFKKGTLENGTYMFDQNMTLTFETAMRLKDPSGNILEIPSVKYKLTSEGNRVLPTINYGFSILEINKLRSGISDKDQDYIPPRLMGKIN